jgi:hypothetical protein
MGVTVPRVAGDGALKCGYCLRQFAGLQAGKAKIVLDEGVGRLQERRFAQGYDSIGGLAGLEKLGSLRKQSRNVPGGSRDWGRQWKALLQFSRS